MGKNAIRHPEDPSILLAADFDALERLRGVFRRARGVLCPYDPLSADEVGDVVAFARSRISPARPWHFTFDALPGESETLRNPGVRLVAGAMCAAFRAATGRAPVRFGFTVNQVDPKDFHAHRATLTYTLTGPGTVAMSGSGEAYAIPARHLFFMGDDLLHRSPAYAPSCDAPRIMLAVF